MIFSNNHYPTYAGSYHSADSIGSVIEHLDLIKAWKIMYDTSKEIVVESRLDYPMAFRRWIKHLFPEIKEEKQDEMYIYSLTLVHADKEEIERIFAAPLFYSFYEEAWDLEWVEAENQQGSILRLTVDVNIPNGNLLEAIKNLHQYLRG